MKCPLRTLRANLSLIVNMCLQNRVARPTKPVIWTLQSKISFLTREKIVCRPHMARLVGVYHVLLKIQTEMSHRLCNPWLESVGDNAQTSRSRKTRHTRKHWNLKYLESKICTHQEMLRNRRWFSRDLPLNVCARKWSCEAHAVHLVELCSRRVGVHVWKLNPWGGLKLIKTKELWRASSRLYRSRFLQPNTHFAAFFEI